MMNLRLPALLVATTLIAGARAVLGKASDSGEYPTDAIPGLHSPSHDFGSCPLYGCVFLPRDVAFDTEAREALQIVRNMRPETSASTVTEISEISDADGLDGNDSAQVEGDDEDAGAALRSLQSSGNSDAATLTLIGYKGGKIGDQINQDRAFVVSSYLADGGGGGGVNPQEGLAVAEASGGTLVGKAAALLGVFDGHAKLGELVSQYATSELPVLLAERLNPLLSPEADVVGEDEAARVDAIKSALFETFLEVDRTAPADNGGGCTASVVLQLEDEIYVANAGDSRSFIVAYARPRDDVDGDGIDDEVMEGEVRIIYATREDKPHLPEERERVEKMGGTVKIPPPERLAAGASSRVMYVDKKRGHQYGLAMSRSIGDWDAGQLGVVPDPIVERISLSEIIASIMKDGDKGADGPCFAEVEVRNDGKTTGIGQAVPCKSSNLGEYAEVSVFAVSATDGLLDYVQPEDIVQHIALALYDENGPHLLTACEDLVITAAQGWHNKNQGRYRDDIAIAVSKLSIPMSKT